MDDLRYKEIRDICVLSHFAEISRDISTSDEECKEVVIFCKYITSLIENANLRKNFKKAFLLRAFEPLRKALADDADDYDTIVSYEEEQEANKKYLRYFMMRKAIINMVINNDYTIDNEIEFDIDIFSELVKEAIDKFISNKYKPDQESIKKISDFLDNDSDK